MATYTFKRIERTDPSIRAGMTAQELEIDAPDDAAAQSAASELARITLTGSDYGQLWSDDQRLLETFDAQGS